METETSIGTLKRLRDLQQQHRNHQTLKYRALWKCRRADCDGKPHDYWGVHARTSQIVPDQIVTSYIVGGRGSGKTKTGSWNLADRLLATNPDPGDDHTEWTIIAPTYKDARDVCMEGPSGLLRALGGKENQLVHRWDRSFGKLQLVNGAVVWVDAANEGALRIQGKNLYGGWFDEVGLWRNWRTAWEESIGFAVRKGTGVRICTGTPKQGSLAKTLLQDPNVWTRVLRTVDNISNLSADVVERLVLKYEGTRLGRQELDGELLDDVEGALWTLAMIDTDRIATEDAPQQYNRVVVAIDPAVSNHEGSDETGIVVMGQTGTPANGQMYVLEDLSGNYSPHGWATQAAQALEQWGADRIVGEVNNGGDMVEATLRNVDPNIPFRKVHASRGKKARAEPISALYEQHRVHHIGVFPKLEDQMTTWVEGVSRDSPDRLDAMVWAGTDLAKVRRARIVVYDEPRRVA